MQYDTASIFVVTGCCGIAICNHQQIYRVWTAPGQEWPALRFTGLEPWTTGSPNSPGAIYTIRSGGHEGPRGYLMRPTPTEQMPRMLAPKRPVTRRYLSGPTRLACSRRICGTAAIRSLTRLLGGSTSLSLTLSAQWRGSLWWAPMTPFPARLHVSR
jgi:hypothetical protein